MSCTLCTVCTAHHLEGEAHIIVTHMNGLPEAKETSNESLPIAHCQIGIASHCESAWKCDKQSTSNSMG
jgi:hypothetical protein